MAALGRIVRGTVVLGALAVAAVAILAFFGFAVPLLDLLNHAQVFIFPASFLAFALLMLLLGGRARLALGGFSMLGFLLSGWIVVPEMAAGLVGRPSPLERPVVTMMTHNLFGMNYDMGKVSAAILGEDPDIIVFQEYFGEQASALHPLLIAHYPYYARCRGGKRANLGLYSRLPFEQVDDGACPENAYSTSRTAHILAKFTSPEGRPFSVMTSHMDWPLPVERQLGQLAALGDVVRGVEGPLVLAGDFNSTPWSYALRGFADTAGLTRQTRNLVTYPLRWFYFDAWRDTWPFLPLDHVMTRGITVHDVRIGARTASDHLPVVVQFTVD